MEGGKEGVDRRGSKRSDRIGVEALKGRLSGNWVWGDSVVKDRSVIGELVGRREVEEGCKESRVGG